MDMGKMAHLLTGLQRLSCRNLRGRSGSERILAAPALTRGLARKNEIELAPASLGAGAGDRPAMRDHDLTGNRQPKSSPSPLLLIRRAIEPFKNPSKAFAGNSGALIAHA